MANEFSNTTESNGILKDSYTNEQGIQSQLMTALNRKLKKNLKTRSANRGITTG